MQPRIPFSLLAAKGTPFAHIQLVVHQDPQSFSAKLLSSCAAPSIYGCKGLFLSRYFALPIVELHKVPCQHTMAGKVKRRIAV